jgi:hypothetical protein
MSLCAKCQEIFHAKQRAAGIDLHFTPNSKLRLIRALKMAILFVWMLLDKLEGETKSDIKKSESYLKYRARRKGNDRNT